ncbi:hypothetical protein [Streptomyces fulvorobeus]|uniref:Uncharacterized protein n=1 Tax=Streptomyces fulvorobeus TaxID=284028 RepID=A0A7J0C3D4_9ACTN|nr:hypothetical protein [Streptomyces fulvorobeus]NYE40689.1 hypothetical protein [Streptomyces fulvorobeus]GFM96992.1 hypothetical protein Sfulv_18030 [Streptomyces fulvorobeus]
MDAAPQRAPLPVEPLECRQRAEDTALPDTDRLLWAVLAVAGELADIRRALAKRR